MLSQKLDSSMYFIMAYVDDFDRYRSRSNRLLEDFPKILFGFSSDTLVIVDTLNAVKSLKLERLVHYSGHKLVFFSEKNILNNKWGSDYFSILDYSSDLVIRRYRPVWDTAFADFTLGISPVLKNENILFNLERENEVEGYVDYGRDKYFNRYKLKPEDFRSIYVEGWSGLSQSGPGGFSFNFVKKDYSVLKVPRTKDYSLMPDAPYQLPDYMKNERDPHVWVLINNSDYFIGTGTINYKSPTDSTKKIWIYDKRLSAWKSAHIPGLGSKIRIEGDWLFGAVLESKFHQSKMPWYKDSLVYYYEKFNARYSADYGQPPNFVPLTGKLFLYHLPSDYLILWDTEELDSEILSVRSGTVYYRVFDEIRSVELDEKAKVLNWRSIRLLVKDPDRVPYVHWMFVGADTKLKEVWVNRPQNKRED